MSKTLVDILEKGLVSKKKALFFFSFTFTATILSVLFILYRKFNFDGCTLTWNKPEQFGEAKLSGYLMTINRSEIVNLPANSSSYTFTEGKLCHKYTFTLKVSLLDSSTFIA